MLIFDLNLVSDLKFLKLEIIEGLLLNIIRVVWVFFGLMFKYLVRDLMRFFFVVYVEVVLLDVFIKKIMLVKYLVLGFCKEIYNCKLNSNFLKILREEKSVRKVIFF